MGLAVGMRFGRYELLQKIGAGGMGEVYRARDNDLRRDVALKFLPSGVEADAARMDLLAQEARAASALNHPAIVTIHEIGRAEGRTFIVMELVEGRTLRSVIEEKPIPTRRVLDLGVQLAEALARAHAAGIVHRDLKPENVMVTRAGHLKLLDFGLATLRPPVVSVPARELSVRDAPARSGLTTVLSPVGGIGGTIGYMSPEQASGRTVDYRSDQFALGVILYELASRRHPFQRDSGQQTITAIIESDPEPLATRAPIFPAPARWIVERCLAKEPAERYASTDDLAREIRDVRDHLSEVNLAPMPVPSGRTRPGWVRAVALAALVLLLVAAAPWLRQWADDVFRPSSEQRIAVLPFRATTPGGDEQRLCDGLFEYVVARLGEIERFERDTWVVPAVEVRQAGVVTPDAARRALGATLAVTGSAQRSGPGLVVTASLVDTQTMRQLRARTLSVDPGEVAVLERTVDAVVELLRFEMDAQARAALRAGATDVAEASILHARALGYTSYTQARTALERYEQEQNLERAIELLTAAIARDPRYGLAHAGLGEAYWRLSRFTRQAEHVALAEQHARRALEIDPLVGRAWVTLGMVHVGTSRAEDAVRDFERALQHDPRDADAWRELANAHDVLGNREQAEATYKKAIALHPEHWSSYSYFGRYLILHNRPAEAEASYRKALELVPDNVRVWSGLGVALHQLGRHDEAAAAFRRSLALHPTASAASNLGTLEFDLAHYAKAARAFEQAVTIDNRDYRLWRNLAAGYYWTPGERARAAEAFRRAAELVRQEIALDPRNARLHADLADACAMLGDKEAALLAAREAAALGGGQADVAQTLAEMHEQLGDRDEALGWQARAFELGSPISEVERAPAMARLRTDPRYRSLVARIQAGAAPQGR